MDFSGMFQTWINVLTKPGEATFEAERHSPNANLTTAIIWIIIAAFILAIFSALSALISQLIGGGASMMQMLAEQADLPPEVAAQMAVMTAGGGVAAIGVAFCYALIFAPVGFLIGSAIYFIIAKLFKGTGSFEEQTYLMATFIAPLTIISGVASIVPILGGCVSSIIGIYQLVLSYYAIKVAHQLTSGKAIGVVLIPVLIAFLCVGCSIAALLLGVLSLAGSQSY
jgi:hypothetical protein